LNHTIDLSVKFIEKKQSRTKKDR